MAEFKLSYTANEINNKLGKVDELTAQMEEVALKDDIPTAVESALTEAKATGEFDGEDGVSATHSWNGTTLTITSASGTSSANLKGDKGDQGEKGSDGAKGDKGDKGDQGIQGIQGIQGVQGETGPKGETGAPGYTPVRGTDYWTESDKAEIKSYVDEAILGGAW